MSTTFVPALAMIETRFLLVGEVFECNDGKTYRVTGEPFTQLGTTMREVEVADPWGRKHFEHMTITAGEKAMVIGRYL